MPEVAPFFKKLANLRRAMNSKPFPRVTLITGIVTNSDDRVSSILTNLGLRVNTARRAQQDELSTLVNKFDLDFTTTSYDVGHTKPAKEIFEAAFGQSGYSTSEKVQCVHIGDDLVKDVQGADQAGWESALLLPSNPSVTYVPHQDPSIRQTSLQLLHSELGSWWSKTELIVKLLREVLSTPNPRGALAQQRASIKAPPIKGKMWISKTTLLAPESDEVPQLLYQAIDDLKSSPSQIYTRPAVLPVEAEWTGYRPDVDSQRARPDLSERQHYDRLMSDTATPITILYFHGGAFIMMDPASHRNPVSHLSHLTGGRALNIRYRLAPQHPFPAALLDCFIAYLSLLYPPPSSFHSTVPSSQIILAGDSAGGNLALALTQLLLQINHSTSEAQKQSFRFHEHEVTLPLPLPAGLATHSPYLDLTGCLPSRVSNAQYDYLPPPLTSLRLATWPKDEVWPTDPPRGDPYCETSILNHPLVSPVSAKSWEGAPPMWLAYGEEMLADEGKQLASLASEQGVKVMWEQWEAQCHCFGMIMLGAANSKRFFKDWAGFCKAVCVVEEDKEEGKAKGSLASSGLFFEAKTLKEREVEVAKLKVVEKSELDELMLKAMEKRELHPAEATKTMPKL
ncbi:uncharacterized protein KY384_000728 [Bacidia gigantensis]|uniref:uncharacterized protein n=1 Tax=Bacidia gigantensis TaxID=2732470 RepID=UPI001D04832A|nr:uncharacterized protein KY384_000728 [Bacidia gigantensis]KAG8525966.1 hypothetical protein KY384_000728 [Bacidia gigantensis]